MYSTKLNNYHSKPKNSTIYTPKEVSKFIYELLKDKISKKGFILDPCFGRGSLLEPWFTLGGYAVFGIDNDPQAFEIEGLGCLETDFLQLTRPFTAEQGISEADKNNLLWLEKNQPALILCNPPFNGMKPKLAPEIWLDKIIELFGKEVPIVLFTPIGFRLNLKLESKRYQKFTDGTYPAITSQITLPKNIFPQVKFHSEILIFNIPGLQAHYFFTNTKNNKQIK